MSSASKGMLITARNKEQPVNMVTMAMIMRATINLIVNYGSSG